MATHYAACSCEQLRLWADGDPVRISICHCLACQRRTGSAFGIQARWPSDQVRIEGGHAEYTRTSDDGVSRTLCFCPECGSTVFWSIDPEHIAAAIGAFADPTFPSPTVSVYGVRRHPWVQLPDTIREELN